MLGAVYRDYCEQDPLNRMGKRNIHTAAKWEYNCAGYALGCFSWYQPDTLWDREHTSAEEKTKLAVKTMLSDFQNLRVIASLSDLMDGERAVAFRVEGDGTWRSDFHYILRGKDKIWRHKMGGASQIKTMTEEEVFSPVWCGRYEGPIVLFARKDLTNIPVRDTI